ncbi:MAG: hypothetical protein ABW080_03195 [Candidatus Thiodiazotropha sp.]
MEELLFLNGLLLSRLVYIFNDGRLSSRTLIIFGLVQVVLCLLVFAVGWLPSMFAVLVLLILLAPERWLAKDWLNESRFIGLLMILIATALLRDKLILAPWLETALSEAVDVLWHEGGNMDALLSPGLWFLLGFLLVANEANLLIRSLFHRFGLEPQLKADDVNQPNTNQLDEQEFNAGRVIGILERWLMYSVLLVSQNFNVIALIIAAKGFARFRQMEERAFAEYVLIGTLSSMLLTILVAQIIGRLI